MIVARGTFSGRGSHDVRGTFTMTRLDGQIVFETSDDFFFDGSPAPGFALARGNIDNLTSSQQGTQAIATDFRRIDGAGRDFSMPQIPVTGKLTSRLAGSTDISEFDSVFMWCFLTPFLLAVAPIQDGN